jgi:hypothetical protein
MSVAIQVTRGDGIRPCRDDERLGSGEGDGSAGDLRREQRTQQRKKDKSRSTHSERSVKYPLKTPKDGEYSPSL